MFRCPVIFFLCVYVFAIPKFEIYIYLASMLPLIILMVSHGDTRRITENTVVDTIRAM